MNFWIVLSSNAFVWTFDHTQRYQHRKLQPIKRGPAFCVSILFWISRRSSWQSLLDSLAVLAVRHPYAFSDITETPTIGAGKQSCVSASTVVNTRFWRRKFKCNHASIHNAEVKLIFLSAFDYAMERLTQWCRAEHSRDNWLTNKIVTTGKHALVAEAELPSGACLRIRRAVQMTKV